MLDNEYCLDCLREEWLVPNRRAKNQSYCTHHVYQRTQRGRAAKSIEAIVESGEFEKLDGVATKGRNSGQPLFSEEAVGKVASAHKRAADEAMAFMDASRLTRVEQAPFKERAFKHMLIVEQLRWRRKLTPEEINDVRVEIDMRFPVYELGEDEFEYTPRTEAVMSPSELGLGPSV